MPFFILILNSLLLGVGLAMDAFSVSLANGLNEPCMQPKKSVGVAAVFAFFQAAMPLIGWVCVFAIAEAFDFFQHFIPWIALGLLTFIGIKMLIEGIKHKDENVCRPALKFGTLIVQGIATSIDALSVGFTIAEYNFWQALLSSSIIGLLTFCICLLGIFIGKKAGTKLAGKASILGGVILIIIGLEIFITSWF